VAQTNDLHKFLYQLPLVLYHHCGHEILRKKQAVNILYFLSSDIFIKFFALKLLGRFSLEITKSELPYSHALELHLIASQSSCFVRKKVADLAKVVDHSRVGNPSRLVLF
jgi:hypothetical protein